MNKIKCKTIGGSSVFVNLQPGNMTKYLLVLTCLENADDHCNTRVLSWVNARKSMGIPEHWCKHTDPNDDIVRGYAYYIADKMDCGMGDAMPIARCVIEEML